MRDSDTRAIIALAKELRHDRVVRCGILSLVAGDSYDEAIERVETVIAALPDRDELPKGRDSESRTMRAIAGGIRETMTQGLKDMKQLRELDGR